MKQLLTALFLFVALALPADCQIAPAARKLALQFNTNSEVFTTTNPDLGGTPLTLTSATGISPANGLVLISMGAGFTAPVTLTAFTWQVDNVTSANAGWRRISPDAGGYSQAVDAHYTNVALAVPPNTPFLIMSSGAVTGNVYVNCKAHPSNNNTASGGYPNQ